MKVTLKNGLNLLSFPLLVCLMVSCFGNNDYDDFLLTDAELVYFGLSHDSLPTLQQVAFSIDNRGEVGLIYNYDSMAFGTVLPEKVIIDYKSGVGAYNVLNITNGDSIWVQPGDSIDISSPLSLKVHAIDGLTTKIYIAQLNIHKIDPDSVQYQRIASELSFLLTEDTKTVVFNNRFLTYSRINSNIQLHSSSDAINWTQEAFSGVPDDVFVKGIQSNGNTLFAFTEEGDLYVRYDLTLDQWILVNKPPEIKIRSILGYKNADLVHPAVLSLVIEFKGVLMFATTEDFSKWNYDSISLMPVPADFPLYEFSNHSYKVMHTERITLFGGNSLNGDAQYSVWSTENGLYWAKLSGNVKGFPKLSGVNVFYYNNEFWLINGNSEDEYNKRIYYSKDGGITWSIRLIPNYSEEEEESFPVPEDYSLRNNASVVTDKDSKYFFIIGGKQDSLLPEVWKGFLNKMEFEH